MYQKRLREVPLFAKLSKHEIETLGNVTDEIDVPEGHVLTREGDLCHEFFVIESGRAEVTRDGAHVADLGPGDFFGEIALIEDTPRTATVTTTEPTEVVVLTASSFRGLKHTAPSVYDRAKDAIAERKPATAT